MGAASSTVAVTEEDAARFQEGLAQPLQTLQDWKSSTSSFSPILKDYVLETTLLPGSGRRSRTFRVRHSPTESTAVLKALWLREDQVARQPNLLKEYHQEVQKLKEASRTVPHLVAWTACFVGEPRTISTATTTTTGETRNQTVSVRPVFALRPHVYTTLHDRLANRPLLQTTEKWFLTFQLLHAVKALHEAGLVHGSLATENVGLTSWGAVVLLDAASQKAVHMPDDDPTDYLYFFHPPGGAGRCYLAPERFQTRRPEEQEESLDAAASIDGTTVVDKGSSNSATSSLEQERITPAMDMFSLGCVLVEIFLNGERCLDLGQLLEYRAQAARQGANAGLSPTLLQTLSKLESSALRAACRRMLSLQPEDRLSAGAYVERLEAAGSFPSCFNFLWNKVQQITRYNHADDDDDDDDEKKKNAACVLTPDARMAQLAAMYDDVLWETMGIRPTMRDSYGRKVLGTAAGRQYQERDSSSGAAPDGQLEEEKENDDALLGTEIPTGGDLLAETEALLQQLRELELPKVVNDKALTKAKTASKPASSSVEGEKSEAKQEQRSALSQSALLIYLQWILSTVRHVQRPSSKGVGLALLRRLAVHVTDEARLQRIVPMTVALLNPEFPQQDALVRASALNVLTDTVSRVQRFAPSDANIFSEYILKRVSPWMSDGALCVRLSLTSCLGTLAETARRFLEVRHAVRLYEAAAGAPPISSVHGSSGTATPVVEGVGAASPAAVFAEDVTRLLDPHAETTSSGMSSDNNNEASEAGASNNAQIGKVLLGSTYQTELSALQETFSRWVVYIATDQSEHASLPKRALLQDLGRLCTFFGWEGVMSFLLPQILSFLNDRKDWQLRVALFENLPSVCRMIGRAATEEFVLPCIEIGLVDGQEQVIRNALLCLSRLMELGLLSRALLVGESNESETFVIAKASAGAAPTLLERYAVFLIHPSEGIRRASMETFTIACRSLGMPDSFVYVLPFIRPFMRFQPSVRHLTNVADMELCLDSAWTRERFRTELGKLTRRSVSAADTWTTVGVVVSESAESEATAGREHGEVGKSTSTSDRGSTATRGTADQVADPQLDRMREYLRMYARHTRSEEHQISFSGDMGARVGLLHGIEGSVKTAQRVMFPRQDGRGIKGSLPEWYRALREMAEASDSTVSEASTIRSLSALGHVFGLSIMGPEGTSETLVGAADSDHTGETESKEFLETEDSRSMEAAARGEWGAEAFLDPNVVDTSLLVTKMRALEIPPLPPNLGDPPAPMLPKVDALVLDWRPKMNALIASSSPISGHTAPVVRLAVSLCNNFFVSGSHDGTCGVWEIPSLDDSVGILEPSFVYSGHSENGLVRSRINDVAMVEGTHSVASGDNKGSVHIWRVDVVKSAPSTIAANARRGQSRVVGATAVERVNPDEGEVLAVSHFTSMSSSVVVYATQKGTVHSWDLRCAKEPFALQHGPELGYLTSMALGNDRQWLVTGTSRGYLSLWDVRFQQAAKLWRHSRGTKINRVETLFAPPPQEWGTNSQRGPRPHIFVGSASNECAMFDLVHGDCQECFRTILGDDPSQIQNEQLPYLLDIPISARYRNGALSAAGEQFRTSPVTPSTAINCMVGSIRGQNQSFLLTGGSDCRIRCWDFSAPSRCYIVAGEGRHVYPRPTFERVDFEGPRRLMICRHPAASGIRDSNRFPTRAYNGLRKPEHYHTDSIEDLKVVENNKLISCSRDCTVKVWR